MFDILFNPTFWYVALAVVAIVVIIWACIKFPQGKIFVGTILGIAILCFTFYAGIELNFYYSASGGIYGVITGIFDTNTVEVDDVTFKIQNLELTQNSDDLYTAQIMTDDVISLEKGKVYSLYVNDVPTKTLNFSSNYIQARYSYSFYDNKQQLLENDSLFINFAFYTNSTFIEIYTEGGSQAVKYWNYWFNKNTFVITIEETGYVQDGKIVSSEITNDSENVVAYFIGDELYEYQVVATGSKLNPIEIEMPEGIQLNGWKVNNEIVDTSSYIVNENTSFHADYVELVHLELRAGTSQSYTVLDSGYYAQGTTLLDCLGYTLPDTAMTNLGIEMYDGNMSMDWEFDSNVEDIAGGVLYISSLTMQANPGGFYSSQINTETRQYQITDLGLSESVDLSYVTGCYVSEIEIENINTQSNISLVQKDFGQYSPTSYFYSGDKIWTTKDGWTEEKDFSLTYQLDSNLNLIIEVSENLLGDRGSVVVNSYRFSLVNLIIEFSLNVFYLV